MLGSRRWKPSAHQLHSLTTDVFFRKWSIEDHPLLDWNPKNVVHFALRTSLLTADSPANRSLTIAHRPPHIVARLSGAISLAIKYRRPRADRFCWSQYAVRRLTPQVLTCPIIKREAGSEISAAGLRGTQSALGALPVLLISTSSSVQGRGQVGGLVGKNQD